MATKDVLNTQLQQFDIICVRKSPDYKEQVILAIEGKLIYPSRSFIIISKPGKII